ncbi:hypothetical protein ACQJBY_072051 [Aegilops geniculata]
MNRIPRPIPHFVPSPSHICSMAAALLKLPGRRRRPKSFRRHSPSTLPTSTAGRLSPPPPPPGSTCVRHRRPPLIPLTSAVACLQLCPLLHPTSIGPLHPNTAALYAMTVPRAPCSRSG